MMLSSNFNGNFQYNNQSKLQNQQYSNSVDSNSGSVGASSLLTAANTLIFNSPPQASSSSLTSSYIKSPFNQSHQLIKSVSQSPKQKSSSGNFSRQLIELQQSNQQTDLDFDLHYNVPKKQQQQNRTTDLEDSISSSNSNKISKLDEINLSLLNNNNNNNRKTSKGFQFGEFLFKDDDDNLDLDNDDLSTDDINDDSTTDDFEKEDDNASISSVFNFKRMPNDSFKQLNNNANNEIIIGKVLNNPIGYNNNNNRMIQNQSKLVSMNVPILEQSLNSNNNDNIVNSIKKVNFLDETSPMNSISSYAGASITPTSNFNETTPQNSVTTKHSTSRTNMKLQLMKQQAEQSEKRAAAVAGSSISSNNILIHDPNRKNSTINEITSNNDVVLASSVTSSEIIPRNVLPQAFQTETKLEYPTKYHVLQIAKNLQQSCNNSSVPNTITLTGNQLESNQKSNKRQSSFQSNQKQHTNSLNNSYRENANSLASSGDISILPNSSSFYSDCAFNQHSVDSHNSNHDLNGLSSPTSSSFSQADYMDEIEDYVPNNLNKFANKRSQSTNLTNLEIQEEINRIEECLNLPKTLPSDYLNFMSPPTPQSVRASTSCPTDTARLKKLKGLNLTEEDIKLIVRDRQKKDNHNMIERRRRFNINDRIKELGSILPKNNQGDTKQNKGSILKASVEYIKNLQYEINKTKELGEKFNQMTLLNRKLVNRIKELEKERMQQDFITNNDLSNIKKENLNLINSSEFINLNTNSNISKSVNTQPHNNYYYNASQEQQQQNHEQRDREAIEALLNTTNFDLYSNEQNINMTNDSEVVNLLDEIFNTSAKNFNDNLMDSLN